MEVAWHCVVRGSARAAERSLAFPAGASSLPRRCHVDLATGDHGHPRKASGMRCGGTAMGSHGAPAGARLTPQIQPRVRGGPNSPRSEVCSASHSMTHRRFKVISTVAVASLLPLQDGRRSCCANLPGCPLPGHGRGFPGSPWSSLEGEGSLFCGRLQHIRPEPLGVNTAAGDNHCLPGCSPGAASSSLLLLPPTQLFNVYPWLGALLQLHRPVLRKIEEVRAILRTLLEARRPHMRPGDPVCSYVDALIQQGQVCQDPGPPRRPVGVLRATPGEQGWEGVHTSPAPSSPPPGWRPLRASVSSSVKWGIHSACLGDG